MELVYSVFSLFYESWERQPRKSPLTDNMDDPADINIIQESMGAFGEERRRYPYRCWERHIAGGTRGYNFTKASTVPLA
jgi:hypothetical protein